MGTPGNLGAIDHVSEDILTYRCTTQEQPVTDVTAGSTATIDMQLARWSTLRYSSSYNSPRFL